MHAFTFAGSSWLPRGSSLLCWLARLLFLILLLLLLLLLLL